MSYLAKLLAHRAAAGEGVGTAHPLLLQPFEPFVRPLPGPLAVRSLSTATPCWKEARNAKLRSLALPADWIEGLLRLSDILPHKRCTEDRWEELLDDVDYLAVEWGAAANDAGWHLLDLFGCSPNFARRLDRDGLAILLHGRKVISLDEGKAMIANAVGTANAFRPKVSDGRVAIWSA